MKSHLSYDARLRRATRVFAGVSVLAWSVFAATPLPDLDIQLKGAWPPYGRTSAQAIVASQNHVYLAAGEAGLLVFDISTPSRPRHVGMLQLPGLATALAISGEHVLVANRGLEDGPDQVFLGVHIIDVRQPSNPRAIATITTPGPAVEVAVSGTRVVVLEEGFASDSGQQGGAVEVFDLQDPRQPRRLGRIDTLGSVRALAASDGIACFVESRRNSSGVSTPYLSVIDLSEAGEPRRLSQHGIGDAPVAVALADHHAFLAFDTHMQVVDLTDPTRPKPIDGDSWIEGPSSWFEGASSSGLLIAGHHAFTGNIVVDISNLRELTEVGEIDGGLGMALAGETLVRISRVGGGFDIPVTDTLKIIHVADPQQPRTIATHVLGAAVEDVAVSGSLAYVANGQAGLQIVDVSNPEKPEQLANLPDVGVVSRVAVAGTKACLDRYDSLVVVDVSDPRSPTRRGVYDDFDFSNGGWISGLATAGDRAFVFTTFGGDSKWALEVVDLSNPDIPRRLSRYVSRYVVSWPGLPPAVPQFQYTPDAVEGWLIRDASDPANPVQLGSYRAIVEALGGRLAGHHVYTDSGVFDVSDPANPRRVREGFPAIQAISGSLGCSTYGHVEYGLSCYDLSDPGVPRLIGQYATSDSIRAVELRGTDAFVAAGRAGLQILDLSRPSALTRGPAASFPPGAQARAVAVEGKYAYLIERTGLRVLDVSRPEEPILISQKDTQGSLRNVAVNGKTLFVADTQAGLHIFDVSDPNQPRRLSTLATQSPASDVTVAAEYAYVALEGNWVNGRPVDAGVEIIHVGDPRTPRKVGEYATDGPVTGVIVSGHLLAVSNVGRYQPGQGTSVGGSLELVDISEPANPRRIGSVGTRGAAYGTAVSGGVVCVIDYGVWTGGEYALAKMLTIDITDPENPMRLGEYPLVGGAGSPALTVAGNCALLNVRGVLHVVDLSDPSNPRRVNESYPLAWDVWDLTVSGTHLFAVAGGVLQAVDMADLTRPRWLGGYSAGGGGGRWIPAGDYFLNYGSLLQVIDLSNPLSPQVLAVHVSRTRIADVAVSGRFAYLVDWGVEPGPDVVGGRLAVVDLSEPAHPREVGALELEGSGSGVAIGGTTALVAAGASGLVAVDVSDPLRPLKVGQIDTSGWAYDVALAGPYALVADGPAGLQVFDISQPSQLRRVAGHPADGANRIEIVANRAYVWNEQGLLVFDVTDLATPRLTSRIALTPGYGAAVIADDYVFAVNESGLEMLDLEDPSHPRRIVGNNAITPWSLLENFSGGVLLLSDANDGRFSLSVPPFFRSLSRTDGEIHLEWEGWGRARLQRATGINATTWQDVPETESLTRLVLPQEHPNEFFRLRDLR